jgi:hypothetical protein
MPRKKKLFDESALENNRAFLFYYYRLMELSVSMFKWENLPDTVDQRYIEMELFRNGSVVYFNDEYIGNLCLDVLFNGNFDVYGYPIKRRAYSYYNNYNKELDNTNSVIVYNNYIRTNSETAVRMYAKRLYNLDRIIDVNANAQKTPVLIRASEKQRLSMLNLYKEYNGNSPFIFGDKDLDLSDIKAISTQAPYVSDKIYTLKTQIWNEALTYLGISNINIQKKERLITDEVMRNQGGTIASRYSRLESRQKAVNEINKMFGTNISVTYQEDLDTSMSGPEGGEEVE